MLSDLGNCESNRPSCLPLGSLLSKLLKKLQLSKSEDFVALFNDLYESNIIPVIKQKGVLRGCANGSFIGGRQGSHQQSIFGADTFFFYEGRGLQGFYHADKSFTGPGAGMERGKMQQIITPHCLPQIPN